MSLPQEGEKDGKEIQGRPGREEEKGEEKTKKKSAKKRWDGLLTAQFIGCSSSISSPWR
jgi:hypothetical protein